MKNEKIKTVSVMRHYAEQKGAKPSKALKKMWHAYQEKKYGFVLAYLFRAAGTGKGSMRERATRQARIYTFKSARKTLA